MDKSL